MPVITLNIPDDKIQRVVDAVIANEEIPTIPNPDYEPGVDDREEIPQFTNKQWVKIWIRKQLSSLVFHYETTKEMDDLRSNSTIQVDEGILT